MTSLPLASTPAKPFGAWLDPGAMVRRLWASRELTWQFASRRVRARYKGQALGAAWSIADPLITLAIYTFVFGLVLQRASAGGEGGIARFALEVFAGIITFNLFRETVGPAPTLVVSQPNFVKKVVYPLETLPVSQLLVALFNYATGLAVWIVGYAVFSSTHVPQPGLVLVPLVLLPVALLALGVSWVLASLGVFLRDLRTPTGSVLHMLFFLSAIFYRLEDVPESYRWLIALNPLAQSVEAARAVMFGEGLPHWGWWSGMTGAGVLMSLLGYAFFMKSRRAFADVI